MEVGGIVMMCEGCVNVGRNVCVCGGGGGGGGRELTN